MPVRLPAAVCAPRACLIDLDGTLYFRGAVLPGASDALRALSAMKIGRRFLSNTDSLSGRSVVQRLQQYGLHVEESEIFTAVSAVLRHLEDKGLRSCHVLVSSELEPEFERFRASGDAVQWVVVGDCRDRLSYPRLNDAFRYLMRGARLIALQKGRFFHDASGVNLDTGAIVAALEHASGQTALVMGKPSPQFFESALGDVDAPRDRIWLVGDDVSTDIAGASHAGLTSVLVRTGKYEAGAVARSGVRADFEIDSFADLPDLIADRQRAECSETEL